MSPERVLRRRALRLDQHPKHPLFQFALTPKELLAIADISRVSRDDAGKLIGYQRPEVKQHIANIVEYLDSAENVVFPNSIILALSSGITFRQVRGPKVDEGRAAAGTLEIPLSKSGQPKPAWIVDGQQRAFALSKCRNQDLIVPITGFLADDVEVQRDQFLRINSAKPLPRGLITELLPEVSTVLPAHLAARKVPSALCDLLNQHPESPFLGLIRRASSRGSGDKGVVTDTAVVTMLQESLSNPSGCLFPHRNLATGETDFEAVTGILLMYWSAVRDTFRDAWGLPPSKSRLMHGAGIRAMGRLMDKLMGSVDPSDTHAPKAVRTELAALAPHCRWTGGVWEEMGNMRWNDVQNTPQHVRVLSNQLMRLYLGTRKAHG